MKIKEIWDTVNQTVDTIFDIIVSIVCMCVSIALIAWSIFCVAGCLFYEKSAIEISISILNYIWLVMLDCAIAIFGVILMGLACLALCVAKYMASR